MQRNNEVAYNHVVEDEKTDTKNSNSDDFYIYKTGFRGMAFISKNLQVL